MRGLLGEGAPLSAPSIAELKASGQAEYEGWQHRSLADLETVDLWGDGVYVKAGLVATPRSGGCSTGTGSGS